MANQAFEREILNPRERPLSSDINTAQSQLDRSMRETLQRLFQKRVSASSDASAAPVSGFINDGFKVRADSPAGLSVRVTSGLGFQYLPGDVPAAISGIVGLDDLSAYKPLPLRLDDGLDTVISGVPAGPAAGNDRYDIIEVRMDRSVENASSRDVLDIGTGLFNSATVNKTLSFSMDANVGVVTSPANSTAAVSYKVGASAATGTAVEPATTPGYIKIATVFSNNGNMTTSITRANIIDRRNMLAAAGLQPFMVRVSLPTGAAAPPTVLEVAAPPGVEVFVSKGNAPLNSIFTVVVTAGGVPLRAVMVAQNTTGVTPGVFTQVSPLAGAAVINVNGSLATALADTNLTVPATSVAVGTPVVFGSFITQVQAGGSTTLITANPYVVEINGLIQMY